MKIGGFIKSSMIDFPGKISCVVFTCGCNFCCPFCHNASLIQLVGEKEDTGFDAESVLSFLEKRKGLLDGVVITGGEPTLQKDIVAFCKQVKALGFPIKMDTNGSRPYVITELIDSGAVDYLAMDIKALPSRYVPEIAKKIDPSVIYDSIELIMKSGIDYEFRTTCVKPFVDEQMIRAVSETIKGAKLLRFRHLTLIPFYYLIFFQEMKTGAQKKSSKRFE